MEACVDEVTYIAYGMLRNHHQLISAVIPLRLSITANNPCMMISKRQCCCQSIITSLNLCRPVDAQGLVRSIGVSNFSAKKLQSLWSNARIKPAVCQVILSGFANESIDEWPSP